MVIYSKKGFSLIELAVVITIIGLIMAAIVYGGTLARQAQLRAVATEINSLNAAKDIFYQQYKELPGDMTQAYAIWGSSCDSTAANCNGNGDGKIELTNSSAQPDEDLRALQHMVLAKIISGSYNGGTSATIKAASGSCPSGIASALGTNVIASKLDGAGVEFNSDGTGDMIAVGGPNGCPKLNVGVMTPAEAYSIDLKMDDGLAGSGSFYAHNDPSNTVCLSGSSYNLSSTSKACWISFYYRKN